MTARSPIISPPALKPLTAKKRWVVWKWIEIKGADGETRWTKPPFRANAPSKHASSTDPSTWCDTDTAMVAYMDGKCDGIGFVLTDSNISAVDIDDCRNATTGEMHPWAADKIARADNPLNRECEWGTADATRLFAAVRELCGVPPVVPEFTPEMVAVALAEARQILEREEAIAEGDADDAPEGDRQRAHAGTYDSKPWHSDGWKRAAAAYRAECGDRPLVVAIAPDDLHRIRALLAPEISLTRAYAEISARHTRDRAAPVEALMYSLRERGVKTLDEPDTRRRLVQLDDSQALEVAGRLQRLKPEIAPAWSADEVEQLLQLRETLNGVR